MILMSKGKRLLFVQLPLINHSYDYIQGNIEYASASIAGYIINHITSNIEIHNLPSILTQFGSNSMIVKYITRTNPDVVAFTCFLWNIERNLSIAQCIKQQNSSIQIIFGGSEIYPGSFSLAEQRDYVDYFAIGEGEWFFSKYLSVNGLHQYKTFVNGNHVYIQPADELIPAEMIFEPLSGKRLNPMPDGSAFFELTRGCPYKCSYCLYSKNFNIIRELPFDILLKLLNDKNTARNLTELYILSPAINNTKKFTQKIEQLSMVNPGIRLHSEMRAGGIDDNMARSLYRAGFRSMEVGLQTTNMDSLTRVGRNSRPQQEIEGMLHLQNAGIDVKIGLMPGLPGDTRDSFIAMTDMLIHEGFTENIELYPLMMLPGTMIRDQADACGVNYLKKPPYYYNYGWGTSFDDLRYITRHVEDATGLSHIVRKLPDFNMHEEGLYCRGVRITSDDLLKWQPAYTDCIETSVFDYHIQVQHEQALYQGLSELIRHIPDHQLYNIVLYIDAILNETIIQEAIQAIPDDNFIRRINIFHEWKDGCRIRYYQVINEYEEYCRAKELYSFITPIFHVKQENYHNLDLINDYGDNILIAGGVYRAVKKYCKKFIDASESIAFENASEQEEFYRMAGCDYIQLPYSFKIITL
jgi:radical SAM superfamily enzyme YgiQ (UPF0313 family)